MKLKSIEVTVTKTVQIPKFEPSTISVVLSADTDSESVNEDSAKLYKKASVMVNKFIVAEVRKYKSDNDE